MIKFEFVMNVIDAQNLIDCINSARVAAMPMTYQEAQTIVGNSK